MAELNQRRRDFAFYYVKHGNGTRAAIEAGYSKRTAHTTAHRLLRLPKIQEEVERLHVIKHEELEQQEAAKHAEIESVIPGILDISRADVDKLELNAEQAQAALNLGYLQSLDSYTTEGADGQAITKIKIKFNNRLKRDLKRPTRGVYLVREQFGAVKIGIAFDIEDRLSGLRTACPYEIELLFYRKIKGANAAEKYLHNLHKPRRIRGEWFRLNNHEINRAIAYLNYHD